MYVILSVISVIIPVKGFVKDAAALYAAKIPASINVSLTWNITRRRWHTDGTGYSFHKRSAVEPDPRLDAQIVYQADTAKIVLMREGDIELFRSQLLQHSRIFQMT